MLLFEGGDDVLEGGTGNDALAGGAGNNTYRFNRGDGQDTITASPYSVAVTKLNRLELGIGITADDLRLSRVHDIATRQNTALVIAIAGTTDQLTVSRFFSDDASNPYSGLQEIRFADGSTWALSDIMSRVAAPAAGGGTRTGTGGVDTLDGADGDDVLSGRGGADTLTGGAGNDSLQGDDGNDVIDGGAGDDSLQGNHGNNTYRFGRGDGQDRLLSWSGASDRLNVLELKTGVGSSELTLRRVYDVTTRTVSALEIGIAGSSDRFVVSEFFTGDDPANGRNPLQQIRFADEPATVWTLADLLARLQAGTPGGDTRFGTGGADVLDGGDGDDTLFGRAGNDILRGGAGDDTLVGEDGDDVFDGGAGNDTIDGGSGRDTVLFGRGDGQDLLLASPWWEGSTLNAIEFKAGVAPSDVALRRVYDITTRSATALEVAKSRLVEIGFADALDTAKRRKMEGRESRRQGGGSAGAGAGAGAPRG
jgi:Ca2+-binding RTX toxin-like protein